MKLYHGGLIEVKTPRIMATDHIGDFGIHPVVNVGIAVGIAAGDDAFVQHVAFFRRLGGGRAQEAQHQR